MSHLTRRVQVLEARAQPAGGSRMVVIRYNPYDRGSDAPVPPTEDPTETRSVCVFRFPTRFPTAQAWAEWVQRGERHA